MEPVTTDERISYIDLFGRHVVYDVPMSCALCRSCLGNGKGLCWNNGPYVHDGRALWAPTAEMITP